MQLADLVVEVRDVDLNRKGIITPENLDLQITALHNNVGAWTITLPTEHPMCTELRKPGSGLIVTTPNDVFSGPTTNPVFAATPDDTIGTVTFTGVGDTIILADALAWPDPSNDDAETQALAHDDRTDVAESLMHAYVNANIGPGASAGRINPNLVMGDDLGRGTSLSKSARFPVLGDLLNEIAAHDNLGFRVVQRGSVLSFETYQVQDRSALVRLSLANGEISGQKVSTSAPTATRVIVAGTGSLVGRKFLQRTSADSLAAEVAWGRRIERFLDNRGTDQTTQLNQAGDEVLAAEGSATLDIQVVPAEDSNREYGKDWFLGDQISAEVNGVETKVTAVGAILKADSDGLRLGIQLGDSVAFSSSSANQLAGVAARISNLERNDGGDELDGVWQTPTLENAWANYGGAWANARFMRKNGVVYVQGLVALGADGTDILTLPAGFRPSADLIFSCDIYSMSTTSAGSTPHTHNAPYVGTRVNVHADGTVSLPAVASFSLDTTYLSLSGITFPAEA